MSYLLTEIALEMLGYKFYDIDGNFGPTSFQSTTHLPNSNFVCEDIREGDTLDVILNLVQTGNGEPSENNTENTNATLDYDSAVEASTTTDISSSNVANSTPTPHLEETILPPLENIKRPLPNALSKLLDNECERIRNQILRHKNVFVQTNADTLKINDQRGAVSDCLSTFKEREKDNLQNELQTMNMFRKQVESSLFKVRSDSYEKYRRIFMPTTDDTTPIAIDNI